MWVNEKEEEELVFDWGDKHIDLYIPKKQESYSVRSYSCCINVNKSARIIGFTLLFVGVSDRG